MSAQTGKSGFNTVCCYFITIIVIKVNFLYNNFSLYNKNRTTDQTGKMWLFVKVSETLDEHNNKDFSGLVIKVIV